MVLDEDALEAMLQRQKRQEESGEAKASKQTELKEQTEEFEVYERPGADHATGTGLRTPPPKAEQPPGPVEEESEDPEPVEETLPAPEPVEEPPEPAPEPEPTPEPEPEAEAAPEPEAEPDAEPEPQRPRVWPPLSGSRNGATERREAPAPATVQEPTAAEPEPVPVPPMSEPEPEPTVDARADEPPEPETPTMEEAVDADPHAHAHADLDVDGGGVRVAIVQALFNQEITDMMADLATARVKKRGAKVTHHLTVPGVYDLPLAVARLLERDDVDCAVVIGVVVQGETSHDELITNATARTLQQLSLDVDKPIGFGVTGPGMTWKQAEARVANGAHAVDAALAQVELLKSL